ncbi:two-component system sensor histidine kinase NtrB [Halalkalibacter urbisdiaboli]|uniref:two-component system sensor histidine kinase NtrB n=1 Tax=Halalkalibacter urbisdiaboli TaxID=1960589 RepID=UPI000B4346F3|nr:HAMP domain-containing sensor histidine kinase [Halalkalibacter urbisdiaboli]
MNRLHFKNWFRKRKSLKQIDSDHEQQGHYKFLQNDANTVQSSEDYHAVIGRMAAFFAHEIRNPLTSIIGFIQFMEQDPSIKSNPHMAHYTSIIREEATRMETLIQELLSLSKSHLHHDNLSIIDIKHSIEKVVTIYSMQTVNKSISFRTDLLDDIYITGNPSQFERLLINLVKNAVEAIKEMGTIEIRVTKENKFVNISIIDSGPGLTPEQLEQIFYPFYTTKDEGTGLGLPICKTIVETMNGSMDIQNHTNKGVHVKLKIPQNQHTSYKG